MKRAFSLCVAVIALAVALAGCFDLGDAADETDYTDYFGKVKFIASDNGTDSYKMSKFVDTDELNGEDNLVVPLDAYKYIGILCSKNCYVTEFALYFYTNAVFYAEGSDVLDFTFYISEKMPTALNDGGIVEDSEIPPVVSSASTDPSQSSAPEPDEPSDSSRFSKKSISLETGTWRSVRFKFDSMQYIPKNAYILIRIDTNCDLGGISGTPFTVDKILFYIKNAD